MAAKRCSQCDINWPDTADNDECHSCGHATWRGSDLVSLPYTYAMSLRRVFAFERYYEQRGERALDPNLIDVERQARILGTADEIIALNSIPVDGEELPVEKLPPEHFGRDAHLLRRDDS